MTTCDERVKLVDALIEHAGLSAFERAALGRPRERFVVDSSVTKPAGPQNIDGVPALPQGAVPFHCIGCGNRQLRPL